MSYSGIGTTGNDAAGAAEDRGTSVVDRNSEIEGTYNTSRDLRIEGVLTGTVNCDGVLFVADGARVDATVDAASIIVSGNLSGHIRCRGRLEITATGSVGGEVETAALVIVEGARYEGEITMTADTPAVETGSQTPATEVDTGPPDTYSLLRRYASGSAEPRDESPASSQDPDKDEE